MNKICLIVLISLCGIILADNNNDQPSNAAKNPSPSTYDVVVESSLSIKPKPPKRNRRSSNDDIAALYIYAPQGRLYRNKRQFGVGNRFPQFPNFQAGAASAQAQAFQNNGPLGGFGASAANAMAQNFNVGPGGINGAASLGGSQAYNLPNGQHINLAYSNGVTFGADGRPSIANSNSLTYS